MYTATRARSAALARNKVAWPPWGASAARTSSAWEASPGRLSQTRPPAQSQKASPPRSAARRLASAGPAVGAVEMRHSARWLISAEQMAAWQAFSTHAFVVTRDGERQGAQAAMDVLVRYTDGQMNLEQFIQEAEGRLRLVREENEQR